ncbi:unnamed protein product [Chilo suppressalis]|uniref:Abnormal spindle-like microcephaly-associated protein ASH domain-containing protein n=1 Tax=Chilo suppressalis TaxID=168631 RepID=A0ABN8AVR0_CHISP|nr:unnamed protein product [Chilo suppressalis]
MSDFLPLIPRKGSVCTDVRPILREVFRDRDYLPPLPSDKEIEQHADPSQGHWIKDYSLECTDLWRKEEELKEEHAKRLSRGTLPNIYHLSTPSHREAPAWRLQHGIIARNDLIPAIQQNAAGKGNTSLWVQNILNRSSCDVSCLEVSGTKLHPPAPLQSPPAYEPSLQSMSIGEVTARAPPPPRAPLPAHPPTPDYVICVPPKLEFINFTVGKSHTQSIRLVNVSKLEVRLSLRPPARRELDVTLCGPRGLTVTAGSATELRVRFTPSDVRPVKDTLLVRVSTGTTIDVPIHCYMQPPILEILVPNLSWWSLWCRRGSGAAVRSGGEVVELGARLLGDVHSARLLLHCNAEHAAFFVLTEDSWNSYCLDTLTSDGAVVCGAFTLSPVWWRGGRGEVRGGAWCRAPHAGLHAAAFRIVCSTAVARPLHLLADAVHFTTEHITLEAHEKDYDICSEDDPACEYYVNLGTTFPNRSLSATIQLVNHSPVIYSYYWSVRPWGVCSCWEYGQDAQGSGPSDDDSERLCIGAAEARKKGRPAVTGQVLPSVEPGHGRVAARCSCALHVCVPDAGTRLGIQRAVLMLILKDIPKESFPPNLDPMIVKTEMVVADPIPGHEAWSREVCEVVCCQLEVWWEVVPLRFVLDPPVLRLPHSRRVKNVDVTLRATQLFGCDGIHASWSLPDGMTLPHEPVYLAPAHSHTSKLRIPLMSLPNEYPANDVLTLNASNNEWKAQSTISRWYATRHPGLEPARAWLGIVPPGSHMTTTLQIHNDTHQQICWWGEVFRWWGENPPHARCDGSADAGRHCAVCRQPTCTCALLQPARGALDHAQRDRLLYHVRAPDKDGCVATLLQARRTAGSGAGTEARASLVFYRVMAPQLVMRALPCHGDKIPGECENIYIYIKLKRD